MKHSRKLVLWAALLAGFCGALAAALLVVHIHRIPKVILLKGAVIKQNSDTKSQAPIANVQVSAENALAERDASSDFSGAFVLRLRLGVKRGEPITLKFRKPDFKPLDMRTSIGDQLYVVRMLPLYSEVEAEINKPGILLSNVLVRYSTAMTSNDNIGSAVKVFQVVNTGNVPCNGASLCSPDRKWKAQEGVASLDAAEGNLLRNARVTCIAGPCPFTRIDKNDFSQGGRVITVSARDWSDTATFLLQGEVFRQQVGDVVRQSYAVIFGRTMNFTLPPSAEGPSIVAELNGLTEIFALGPSAILSWADCNIRVEKNETKDYRCELKPGYRFQ